MFSKTFQIISISYTLHTIPQNLKVLLEFIEFRKKYEEDGLAKFNEQVAELGFFTYLYYSDSDGFYDVNKELENMLKGYCFRLE